MNENNAQSTTTCCLREALQVLIDEEMRLARPLPSLAELDQQLQTARAALRKPSDLFRPLFLSSRPGRTKASTIVNSRLTETSLTVLLGTLTALMQGRPVSVSEQVLRIIGEVPPVPLGDVGISYEAALFLDAANIHAALQQHRACPTHARPGDEVAPLWSWVSEFTSGKGRRYSLTTLAGKGTMIFTVDEANAFEARMHANPGNN